MRFPGFTIDKSTAIAGITGIVVGLALFLGFNPNANLSDSLLADIAQSKVYAGDIGVKVSNKKIQIFSNVDLQGIKELLVTITKQPGVSILNTDTNTEVSLLSPEMAKYKVSVTELKKGKVVIKFLHDAESTKYITIGDIQAVSDSLDNPQFIPLSITNLD